MPSAGLVVRCVSNTFDELLLLFTWGALPKNGNKIQRKEKKKKGTGLNLGNGTPGCRVCLTETMRLGIAIKIVMDLGRQW